MKKRPSENNEEINNLKILKILDVEENIDED